MDNNKAKLALLGDYTVSQVETMIRRYEYSKAYHKTHNRKVHADARAWREHKLTTK